MRAAISSSEQPIGISPVLNELGKLKLELFFAQTLFLLRFLFHQFKFWWRQRRQKGWVGLESSSLPWFKSNRIERKLLKKNWSTFPAPLLSVPVPTDGSCGRKNHFSLYFFVGVRDLSLEKGVIRPWQVVTGFALQIHFLDNLKYIS